MRKAIVKYESTQAERLRTASRQRREQQRDGLRNVILKAAGELFLEHGYEGFSMRGVAERIGYSATTIYRYYEDKDDLLSAVIQEGFAEFATALTNAAKGQSNPAKRLEALGRAYIKFGLESPVYYQMMFMQRADLLFESQKEKTQPMIDSFDALQQAVRAAMDAGIFKRGDVEVYSRVIWSVVHGVTALAIATPGPPDEVLMKKSVDLAMKMLMDGLRQKA